MAIFTAAFQRVEQLERSETYVRGLLGDAARKNVEQMALGLGENVRDLQYFIGQSPWKTEPVIEIHQRLVAESLGEADGVALIDESGVVKQGTARSVSRRNTVVRWERSPTAKMGSIWAMPAGKATA